MGGAAGEMAALIAAAEAAGEGVVAALASSRVGNKQFMPWYSPRRILP